MNNIDHSKTAAKMNLDAIHRGYEKAARIYCAKVGYDPDLTIPAPHPQGLEVPYHTTNWKMVAEDLHDISCKLTSMKEAAEVPRVIAS